MVHVLHHPGSCHCKQVARRCCWECVIKTSCCYCWSAALAAHQYLIWVVIQRHLPKVWCLHFALLYLLSQCCIGALQAYGSRPNQQSCGHCGVAASHTNTNQQNANYIGCQCACVPRRVLQQAAADAGAAQHTRGHWHSLQRHCWHLWPATWCRLAQDVHRRLAHLVVEQVEQLAAVLLQFKLQGGGLQICSRHHLLHQLP